MVNSLMKSRKEMLSKKGKKGFTLMELLIVIAIIVILIAILFPTFASQLAKARRATDAANIRSAVSLAKAQYLSDPDNSTGNFYLLTDGTLKKSDTAPTNAYKFKEGSIGQDASIMEYCTSTTTPSYSKDQPLKVEVSVTDDNLLKVTISGIAEIPQS